MGKCSVCGKKIEYNNFVVIDGIVYHRECAPKIEKKLIKKLVDTVSKAKLDFDEFQRAMKDTVVTTENYNTRVCKYCGAKNSSEWLELPDGERCCKKRACRKKAREE